MLMLPIRNMLYHGTIYKIEKVDVNKGRGRKDFGKGFYIATSKSQAIGMMHKKYNEAIRRRRNKNEPDIQEHLYEIVIDENFLKTLSVRVFEKADEEWLEFILMCRENGGTPHDYDVVIGPTADDDTMYCLRAYWDGLYGEVGTSRAKQVLLDNLEPENLGVQYFIGKQDIADNLIKEIIDIDWR